MKSLNIHIGATTRAPMIIILFLMAFSHGLSAQNMPRTVVGNAGDYYEALQFGNLHWTVGEVSVSLHQNGLALHEGFHQVYYELVVHTEEVAPDWEVSIFPNPATDYLRVRFAEGEQAATAQLYGSTGQLLLKRENLQWEEEFDLSNLPAGSYWLRLLSEDGQHQSYKVLKVRR